MFPHQDQFSGCLIGQCLGDATGFVVEGFSPEACKRYVEDYLKTEKAGEFGRFPFPFGQYSDDSQLARELVQSYVACEKFDPADYAERIKTYLCREEDRRIRLFDKRSGKKTVPGRLMGRIGRAASFSRKRERHAGSAHRSVLF